MPNKKWLSIGGLIIIILLGAGVIGAAVYMIKRPIQLIEETHVETPGEVSPAPEIDTSDWKTHRNEEYGFELKYPSSWYTYEDVKSGWKIISTIPKKAYFAKEGQERELAGANYGLILVDYLKSRTVEEEFERIKKVVGAGINIEKFITEELDMPGVMGYRIYYSYHNSSFISDKGVHIIYIFSSKNGVGVLKFEGDFGGENKEIYEEYAKNFDQIVSTFRFLQ